MTDNTKPFRCAPSGIFMDTFAQASFTSEPVIYNARALVNYFYFVKVLSENSSSIIENSVRKKIPISLFQLNGGNIPITDNNDTYPMRYIPPNHKTVFKDDINVDAYKSSNTIIWKSNTAQTSQYATFLFGESNINTDMSNIDPVIRDYKLMQIPGVTAGTSIQTYFSSPMNEDTGITPSDFGINISSNDLFDWSKDKTVLLKACNILSIHWGSAFSYGPAPFGNGDPTTEDVIYRSSWILNNQIKKYYNNSISTDHHTRMGGFIPSTYYKFDNPTIQDDIKYVETICTYTNALQGGTSVQDDYTTNDTQISLSIAALPNETTKPYYAHYMIAGSGSIDIFWGSIRTIKYYIADLLVACMGIEDNGAKTNMDSSTTWGDICISPDFGLFAQKLGGGESEMWAELHGNWVTSSNPALNIYKDDLHLKKLALEICNHFIPSGDLTKLCATNYCSSGGETCKCYYCSTSTEKCNTQNTGKCMCDNCVPPGGENRKLFFTSLISYIDSSSSDEIFGPNGIIDISKNGIKGMNALIGFFSNAFGPHVNAGWDIGYVFNNKGNGTWIHANFTADDFKDHDVIDENGWRSTPANINITDVSITDNELNINYSNGTTSVPGSSPNDIPANSGPADVALYYLKNSIYGDNETEIKTPPPIYEGNVSTTVCNGGGSNKCSVQCNKSECSLIPDCSTGDCSGYYIKKSDNSGICYKSQTLYANTVCCTGNTT
jgi:hypothetical protein